jgi:catechol 2,3-dioxygenase-like lactoylglutathione lyase family enzyme
MNAGPLTFGRAAPTIAVSDIDRALGFYRDLLGLQVTFTSDATALFEIVSAAGTKIIKRPRDHEYGLRAFVMADPDGNRIDVGQVIDTAD